MEFTLDIVQRKGNNRSRLFVETFYQVEWWVGFNLWNYSPFFSSTPNSVSSRVRASSARVCWEPNRILNWSNVWDATNSLDYKFYRCWRRHRFKGSTKKQTKIHAIIFSVKSRYSKNKVQLVVACLQNGRCMARHRAMLLENISCVQCLFELMTSDHRVTSTFLEMFSWQTMLHKERGSTGHDEDRQQQVAKIILRICLCCRRKPTLIHILLRSSCFFTTIQLQFICFSRTTVSVGIWLGYYDNETASNLINANS